MAILPVGTSNHLAVLNQHSGTVSWIDSRQRAVVREDKIARRISSGCAVRDGQVVILDDATNELVVLVDDSAGRGVQARVSIAARPVYVVAAPDKRSCLVASTWARRLSFVDLRDPDLPTVHRTLDLPFAPQKMLYIGPDQVLVADAFGGSLALVNTSLHRVTQYRELKSTHNITGMARGDDSDSVF